MKDDVKLPPNPITPMLAALVNKASGAGAAETVWQLMQAYARAAIEADRQRRSGPVKAPSDEEILEVMKPCELLTSITRRFYEDEWTEQVIRTTKLLEQSRTLIAKYATTQPPQNPEGWQLVPKDLIDFLDAKEHHLPVEDRHVLSIMLAATLNLEKKNDDDH